MKLFLCLAFLWLLTIVAIGQGFVDSTNQWNVLQTVNFGPSNTMIIKILGDSVINGKSYKKMYSGLVREDSNKVYYIPADSTNEGLLYDFNLEAGDTTQIISYWLHEPTQYICESTDSVVFNGKSFKRWNFVWPPEHWIDNIGNTFGPLNSGVDLAVSDLYLTLLCFHQNDSLIYRDPAWNVCYFSDVSINEYKAINNLSVFPNPIKVGQLLHIHSEYLIKKIEVITPEGKSITQLLNLNNKDINLETSNLTQGVFLIKISSMTELIEKRIICIN